MSIFGKYDIRGKYPSQIDEKKTKKIGKAAARVLKLEGNEVAVGMDVRNSSPQLKQNLIQGLLSQGVNVIDVGRITTPQIYFEVVNDNLDAGFMISASHNPGNYNGIKICREKALDLTYETGIKDIEEEQKKDFDDKEKGELVEKDIIDKFVNKIRSKISLERSFKVVLDPGNGAAALFCDDLFQSLGCDVYAINNEPDGNFPNRSPEPNEELEPLINKVKEVNADLGIAFDGDADRAVFVDEEGNEIPNDYVLSLFVENFTEPGDSVVYEVKCSKTLEDVIQENNTQPILSRVGRSYIKQKMIENEAKVGGELSGHLFFEENDFYDDPFFASAKLLEIMEEKDKKLSELVEKLPKYASSPEYRIKCKNKEEVVQAIGKEFQDEGDIVDIDGVKIYFETGWALVRPSSTEPKLSIRFEAENEQKMKKIEEKVMSKVEDYKT